MLGNITPEKEDKCFEISWILFQEMSEKIRLLQMCLFLYYHSFISVQNRMR